MSRLAETFVVAASFEDGQLLCELGLAAFTTVKDWGPAGNGMQKVVKQGWGLFHNPATLRLEVAPADGGCRVTLDASSVGLGPIQDRNLRNLVDEVRGVIEAGVPAAARGADRRRAAPAAEPSTRDANSPRLFVSYRREDSADSTGRICDALEREFGVDAIFRDVDSIPLGVDFRQHLGAAIQQCQIVLAIIGRDWAGTAGPGAPRRIDDPTDFVRVEIESAIQRNIPVIPLLVNRAVMPRADQLPPEIAGLAYRNGMPIRHDPDFKTDVARLCSALREDLARRNPSSGS